MSHRHQELLRKLREAMEGRYEVLEEIGRGGAARVFRARDPEGTVVALKILHPELAVSVTADRFLREVDLLRKLDHPRLVRVLDSGEAGFFVYYVMPFVHGPTLRQHLDRVRRASVSDTARIARDLLEALEYAHDRNIIHRDVKPDNVMLADSGPVLVDFGIAKAIAEAGSARLTRSGFTVGTSAYMSPEQVLGALDIDRRSDIYSLGCVLFESLAGRPPFVHRQEEIVLQMQRMEPAEDVRSLRPDVPEPLAAAIARALEKDRDRRWRSAKEMLAAIQS